MFCVIYINKYIIIRIEGTLYVVYEFYKCFMKFYQTRNISPRASGKRD